MSLSRDASTLHRRDLLTIHHLEPFAKFCEGEGWTREQPKGLNEVLRMWRPDRSGKQWLIVHKRDYTLSGGTNVQHLTVWGYSAHWATKYFKRRKEHTLP